MGVKVQASTKKGAASQTMIEVGSTQKRLEDIEALNETFRSQLKTIENARHEDEMRSRILYDHMRDVERKSREDARDNKNKIELLEKTFQAKIEELDRKIFQDRPAPLLMPSEERVADNGWDCEDRPAPLSMPSEVCMPDGGWDNPAGLSMRSEKHVPDDCWAEEVMKENKKMVEKFGDLDIKLGAQIADLTKIAGDDRKSIKECTKEIQKVFEKFEDLTNKVSVQIAVLTKKAGDDRKLLKEKSDNMENKFENKFDDLNLVIRSLEIPQEKTEDAGKKRAQEKRYWPEDSPLWPRWKDIENNPSVVHGWVEIGSKEIEAFGWPFLGKVISITRSDMLQLYKCNIDDEGAKTVAQAVGANAHIKELNLNSNVIGDDGAVALAQAIRINTNLLHIGVKKNGFGNVGRNALLQAIDARLQQGKPVTIRM